MTHQSNQSDEMSTIGKQVGTSSDAFPDTSITCPECHHHWYRKPTMRERLYDATQGSKKVENLLKLLDGNRCGICSVKFKVNEKVTIDHIKPKARGGKNHWRNYQLAHQKCNSMKGSQIDFTLNDLVVTGSQSVDEAIESRLPNQPNRSKQDD